MDSLQISTSEKRIAIERDGQSVGELVFNPNDVVFIERYYRLVADIKAKMSEKPFADMSEEAADTGEAVIFLKDEGLRVREQIDHIFGEGTSQMVFGSATEFGVISQFLDGINSYLQPVRAEKLAPYLKPVKGNGKTPRKPRKR